MFSFSTYIIFLLLLLLLRELQNSLERNKICWEDWNSKKKFIQTGQDSDSHNKSYRRIWGHQAGPYSFSHIFPFSLASNYSPDYLRSLERSQLKALISVKILDLKVVSFVTIYLYTGARFESGPVYQLSNKLRACNDTSFQIRQTYFIVLIQNLMI